MKTIRNHFTTHRTLRALFLTMALLLSAGTVRAGNIYVPNFSFESQVLEFGPVADSWQITPQPAGFDTNTFGAWQNFAGLFENTPATNFDHINNADGNQLGYLFAYPTCGIFQDNNSTDWTGAPPTHAFNAVFQPGRSYTLTVGLTTSINEPLNPGSTLQASLYYRDASNNMVIVGSTTVTFETNLFTNFNNLVDFTVSVPGVKTNDAWAGKNIGIAFVSTVGFDLFGGVWDIDNVRLVENIAVPNFSFESQVLEFGPVADSWQITPQPPGFDTNVFGAWQNFAGLFQNTPPTNFDHINNADGNQLGYLFAYPTCGIFQDNNSTDWTGAPPTHAFNVTYKPGKSYVLKVALTSSSNEPLNPGSTLQAILYYRDASNNIVNVGATTVTFDTNVFSNLDNLIDFKLTVPGVKASDPWAGKNIGIEFVSTVGFDLFGGVWDIDNVRLTEFVAPALNNAARTNGQFNFTFVSEPGAKFEILTATNLSQPATNWTSISSFTNVTGSLPLTNLTGANRRFYRAHQLP